MKKIFFFGKTEGKRRIERPGADERAILKRILKRG